MGAWPEVTTAKNENRHEINLSGAAVSQRISEDGLDSTIFQITNLNLLNISDTCLTFIPDDIQNLINLQSLLLYGNKIEVFNEHITSLPKLKVLDLSRNQLRVIPDSLNKMKDLTSINFSSNQIEKLPKIMDFPNLLTIDVSNNKLVSFLDVSDGVVLSHVSDLKLNGNQIDAMPNTVTRSFPSLKNFDIGDNNLKTVPAELANMTKLKDLNLKGNKLSDKRLMKLVDQCRTKQVLDYVREHCAKSETGATQQPTKKGKKGQKKQEEEKEDDNLSEMFHTMKILHVEDHVPNVKIIENLVSGVRPYILCCIIKDLNFDDGLFKKFIQLQTRLHDSICDKRNFATIATHDLNKISPGDLLYTAKRPAALKLIPLMRQKTYTGEQLYQQLAAEADALRKEKKRNVYSGIHKYLYLLEGKPKYACLEDSSGKVISFPPITNSEETKMSHETKAMLIEVTSHASLGACKTVMDKLLQELLLLGVADVDADDASPAANPGYHSLTVQQVKVVDLEGNLKCVYPSRTDCLFEDVPNVKVVRVAKK